MRVKGHLEVDDALIYYDNKVVEFGISFVYNGMWSWITGIRSFGEL